MTSTVFYKEPTSVLDYTIDWTDFLSAGDTIATSQWTTPSADITIDSNSHSSNSATVWLSSGLSGYTYDLVNSITTALGRTTYRIISIFVSDRPNELTSLLIDLRLQLGDTTQATYRYTDEWLLVALESSIMALQRWWGDRYLIVNDGEYVIRNPAAEFVTESPPEIENRDRRPIVLMASILVKSGQLESNSWNVGSWKDAEIAVSTIEGSKAKQFGLGRDWEELKMYILPPTRKLASALRIAHPNTEE